MRYAQAQSQFKSYKANYRLACRMMRLVKRSSESFSWSAGECNGPIAHNALVTYVIQFAAWQTAPVDSEVIAIRQYVASKVS